MKNKIGAKVKMNSALKIKLRGKCGEANKHLGPFDPEDKTQCWGCSSAHVEEFGNCFGTVKSLTNFGNRIGPEVDVVWEPSKLRYSYSSSDLEIVK